MSQHFKKMWMAWKWILACGDQPVLLLHSSRSSSHWRQTTLEEKLMLNAPPTESSKNWMHCLVSALHSFLYRERKQEVKPPLEKCCLQETLGNRWTFGFYSLFLFFIGFETSCSACSTGHHGLALPIQCPGEAHTAIPRCHLCRSAGVTTATHGTRCQPALSEDGSSTGFIPTCS